MKLSKEQIIASNSINGPNMVIAVPGAGKTTILLKRIENLIKEGVEPERILTITFSKAAATELKDRFLSNAKNLKSSPHFHTIHAFSFIILRDYARKKGIDYKLLEGSKSVNKYKLLSDFYREIHNVYISEEKLETLINKIGYIKNMMLSPKDVVEEIDKFEEIFYKYEDFKRKYKFIDFDDMLEIALNILKKDKNIREKYVNMYDYIQVDEGQDTSKLQMEIIKVLTKSKGNLFIVADDDQSIYSFRGADPQGLFSLEKFFPDIKTYYMETNFRCSKNIVTAANNFIDQNKIRYEKNLKSNRKYHSPVEIVKLDNHEEQYRYILEDIKEKNIEYKDVGVLYRNNISAMGLIEVLERKNIPFKINESNKIRFHSHRISTDIIDIINFSKDLGRFDLLEKIYYKINGYISKLMISTVKSLKQRGNVFDSLRSVPNLKSYSIKELDRLERDLKFLDKLNMNEKLDFLEKELGYDKYLKFIARKESLGLQGEVLVFNLLKKISINSENFRDFEGRLKYLDTITRSQNHNGINLSTVHSSKGKEYKHVYLIDIYDGMFPTKKEKEEPQVLIEEERRLFYVGMTRAKDSLKILFPHKIGEEKTEISEFLLELQKSCE